MTENKIKQKNAVVIHPFLLGAFSVITLFSANISEGIGYSFLYGYLPLIACLIIIISFSVIIYYIILLIVKEKHKTGVLTSIFLAFILSYGRFHNLFINNKLDFFRHRTLIPAVLIIIAGLFFLLIRVKKDLKKITIILNYVFIILIFLNVFSISFYYFSANNKIVSVMDNNKELQDIIDKVKNTIEKPDIYYFVFDAMPREDKAKIITGMNDFISIDNLRERGFFIADKSCSDYFQTQDSIAASLNMEYVESVKKESLNMNYVEDASKSIDMIYDNKITYILKSSGYKIVHISDLDRRTKNLKFTDVYYNFLKDDAGFYTFFNDDSFIMNYIKVTGFVIPFDYIFNELYVKKYSQIRFNDLNYIFDKLKNSVNEESPKFVFSHILCPQPMFVFDEDGNKLDDKYQTDIHNMKIYTGQYLYTLKQIDIITKNIIRNSKKPLVIILQSDHGSRDNGDFKEIFNAYYFSDKEKYKYVYNDINPVNSFRVILNNYFGTKLKLLKDFK